MKHSRVGFCAFLLVAKECRPDGELPGGRKENPEFGFLAVQNPHPAAA